MATFFDKNYIVPKGSPPTPNSFDENGVSDQMLNELADDILNHVAQSNTSEAEAGSLQEQTSDENEQVEARRASQGRKNQPESLLINVTNDVDQVTLEHDTADRHLQPASIDEEQLPSTSGLQINEDLHDQQLGSILDQQCADNRDIEHAAHLPDSTSGEHILEDGMKLLDHPIPDTNSNATHYEFRSAIATDSGSNKPEETSFDDPPDQANVPEPVEPNNVQLSNDSSGDTVSYSLPDIGGSEFSPEVINTNIIDNNGLLDVTPNSVHLVQESSNSNVNTSAVPTVHQPTGDISHINLSVTTAGNPNLGSVNIHCDTTPINHPSSVNLYISDAIDTQNITDPVEKFKVHLDRVLDDVVKKYTSEKVNAPANDQPGTSVRVSTSNSIKTSSANVKSYSTSNRKRAVSTNSSTPLVTVHSQNQRPTSSVSISSPSNSNKKVKLTTSIVATAVTAAKPSTCSGITEVKLSTSTTKRPVTHVVRALTGAKPSTSSGVSRVSLARVNNLPLNKVGNGAFEVFNITAADVSKALSGAPAGCMVKIDKPSQPTVYVFRNPVSSVITKTARASSVTTSNIIDLTGTANNLANSALVYATAYNGAVVSSTIVSNARITGGSSLRPSSSKHSAVLNSSNSSTAASSAVPIETIELLDSQALPVAKHEVVSTQVTSTDVAGPSGIKTVLTGRQSNSQQSGPSKQPEKLDAAKQNQGMDQNQFEEMENELMCTICANLFIKSVTLGCSHSFCQYCIETWKKKKSDCPICRNRITSTIRTLVLDNIIEKMMENASQDEKDARNAAIEERKKIEDAENAAKKEQNKRGGTARRGRVRTVTRTTNANTVTTRSSTNSNVPVPQPIAEAPPLPPFINITDSPESTTDDGDDSNEEEYDYGDYYNDEWYNGVPGVYYGGYGRCYSCGDRGHWANGCPFR